MRRLTKFRIQSTVCVLACLILIAAAPSAVRGTGVVAADQLEASNAGAEVLRMGGNAVDAAVAAVLSAAVVQPSSTGLGGGGFAVVVTPEGKSTVVDFREVAPSGATQDMYRTADGGVDRKASRVGGAAVAVPGQSRGLAWLLAHHGTLPARAVVGPALRQASKGFPLGTYLSRALGRNPHAEVKVLFDGVELRPGTTVRRQRLADTLRKWASTRGEDLHTGAGASAMATKVQAVGGTLSRADLEGYEVVVREPMVANWKGKKIVTMPLPSSGGVVLIQVLRVLEGYDLKALGHNSSDYVHLVTEAMKHAYADRAHHLGDPAFVDVPTDRLVSDERMNEVRGKIWPGRSFGPEYYGKLIAPLEDAGTEHISVVDSKGGAVAITSTINTLFGSGVVVESLGVIMNNEMDDFAAAPGVPNAYGLVGNAANAIAPGKRPLSSMSPTVVIGDDGVELVVGASGGSKIISGTLQTLLNVLVFDMDPQEAVSVPRFHHQWQPDVLALGFGIPDDVARDLEGRGHTIVRMRHRRECEEGDFPFWECFLESVQVVTRNGADVRGGSDPSKDGAPAGAW